MALHVFVIKETELEDPQDLRARSRKFLNLTNERKNMSTKTNFKRVALVAVASMGLGVLTSVSPAFAGAPTAGDFGASATAATDNFGIVSVTGKNIEMLSNGQLKISNAVAEIDAGASGDILRLRIPSGSVISTFAEQGATTPATLAAPPV